MAFRVKFMSLQKAELEYEVAIRGETPASTVQELRKQIAKCGPLFPSEDILTSPFEPADDLNGVVDVLVKVNSAVESTSLDKNTLLRTQNTLNHLYHRLNRIACDDKYKENYDQCVEFYKRTSIKVNALSDAAIDHLATTSSDITSTISSTPVNVTVTCEGSVNMFAKLKFDGKSCVRAFIQRCEELCHTKNISPNKILTNATEIFTGDALHWYRSIRDTVATWNDLAESLRRDFDQSDYDYRLLTEIRSRTQGESENIVIYLSIMSGLFSRLTKKISDEDKLEIILHNVRPIYANALSCVSEIKSIDELRTVCRNYEAVQSRFSQFKEPPKPSTDTLAPEFAYSGQSNNKNYSKFKYSYNNNDRTNKHTYNKQDNNNYNKPNINSNVPNYVHVVDSSNPNVKSRYCPRCRNNDHNLRQCTASKDEVVCFTCGRKGFKTPDCPSCSENKHTEQKKLVSKNCVNNFDSNDWNKWLQTIKLFFNSYNICTVLSDITDIDDRPCVSVKINDLTVSGLLDSGAAVTILGNGAHTVLESYDLPLIEADFITVTAAGGQNLNSIGYMNVPIHFENQFHIIKAFVVPDIKRNLILGIDFWRIFKLCPKYVGSIAMTKTDCGTLYIPRDIFLHDYAQLDHSQKQLANNVINQFEDISFQRRGLGVTDHIVHRIETGAAEPIRQRYYRLSPEKQRILIEQVDEMLSIDVIEPCESAWSSPVLIVMKKNGQPRFCLDSRKLNSVTKRDAYNLPYISEILDNLRDARYLSSIDLSKSFWQIPICPEHRDKTAFYVPGRGTFRFKRTAFGLTNAPATQQRLVDKLFAEFDLNVFAYLDDIIIVSKDFNSHMTLLLRVLEKLRQANLTVNLEKCNFFRSQLKYLGYVVDSHGLRTDPAKVESILNYPTPTCRKDLKRFLGTATWYRRFVPNFSTIAGPLNKLTSSKKGTPPFKWTQEADKAFQNLKECLVSAPVLSCPDYSKPFEVHTDASSYGVGAMLTQSIDGKEHPIAYMSKSLTSAEKNYSITERETLAVITALEHWRCYIENGQQFTVYTDHSALKWFLSLSNPTGRLARWGVRLSAFNFVIKHRRGVDNVIPDALSRIVPVSAISTSNSYLDTKDSWYKNIYNGCLNDPSKFPNFIIRNNQLFRLSKNKHDLTSEFSWKEVVPSELHENVITENHAEPTAGHMGIFKTYRRLALRYYWPRMYQDVVKFIGSCGKCLAYKSQNHQTLGEMGRPKHCSRPFQMISIDLMGPLPVSKKQNNYILVITCCFSKFCLIFPIKKATSDIITRILEESVFLFHGIPQTVLMDNGTQFTGKVAEALFQKYKVPNVYYTPKYTPQVNLVERYNRTIITCISTYVNDDHRSWDLFIPQVQFAINNSVNEATGFTPSFLVFGREIVPCGSHYIDNDHGSEIVFLPRDQYAENLGCMSSIFDNVQSKLWQAHVKNTSRYNLRRKFAEFDVGDVVMKRAYFLSDKESRFSKKLAPKFIKAKIIAKKSPLVYVLQDMSGKNIGSWHIKDLKLVGQNKF
jgi:hypothetical protein